MYSLQWVFIWQYSNKVGFISMGEAEMGTKGVEFQIGGQAPLPPFVAATGCVWSIGLMFHTPVLLISLLCNTVTLVVI